MGEPPPAAEPSATVVAEADRLCDEGRFVSAHALLRDHAPMERWRSTRALCVGARLARHCGAPRLSAKLALRAYRRDPRSAEARFWAGTEYLEQRGPLAAWAWSEGYEPPEDTSTADLATWTWLRASILIAFRDFTRAEACIEQAERLQPEEPYNGALRVSWLMAQDRYDEALAAAERHVSRHPRHRASIQALAGLLQLHGRFAEAIDVLLRSAGELECGAIYAEAARLSLELRRYRPALGLIERAEACLPLLEDDERRRFAGMRSDIAYFLGDDATAIAEARKVGGPFFESIAERLEERKHGTRVLLNVEFVRQHHLGCVPATLTMLGRFWNKSVDQVEIADRICYNGTPAHAERSWAEQHGWLTREFTVGWDAARGLLDRGVPFVITTVSAISAHAQAIVGYDERRGTISVRDPYIPAILEAGAESFFEHFAAHGPRGLALVPRERAELLDGLSFPDAELYDALDQVERALGSHDRAAASQAAADLERRAPGHRLSLLAQRALASYDANPFELERVAAAYLELFPKEPTWLLTWLGALRRTASPERLRAKLTELCQAPEIHPAFHEMLAGELVDDARHRDETERILRKVARQLRDRAGTLAMLAHSAWRAAEHDEALALYRLAACLEPTSEAWSEAYSRASLARGRSSEAIAFLEQRASFYQRRSAAPSLTLFSALEALDRTEAAFEALDRALDARAGDGELLCFAAEACARYGLRERAERHLEAARTCSAPAAWQRSAAAVASHTGDHERALELWQAVVAADPLALDAQRALSAKLSTVHGPRRAREHVRAASARFPENVALLELSLEWLTSEEPGALEVALRRLIALEPGNAWARRELVLTLGKLGRVSEARSEMKTAIELAPHEISTALVEARLCELEGDFDAARRAYRTALERSPDLVDAIAALVESAGDHDESLRVIDYVEARVRAASVSGDGVIAWYHAARRHLAPEELTTRLESLRAHRPDLWWVWACQVRHLVAVERLNEALELADDLARRFPLLLGSWLELANVLVRTKDTQRRIEVLERATSLAPGSVPAWLALADAQARAGAEDHGRGALERGLRHNPQSGQLLLELADIEWRAGARERALGSVSRAIEADPTDAGAWSRLAQWDSENDDFDATDLVRQLVDARPWDVQLWMRQSELLSTRDPARALTSIERVIELDPLSIEAHDLRAVIAARLGHRALAEAACQPKQLGTPAPLALRGRQAWVMAMFGDVRGAMERMQRVIADRPDYVWGLQQIADWAESLQDTQAALEAARALVRLEPSMAYAHGYLGQALAEAGDKDAALLAFRRALELEPGYLYAATRYVELLLERSETQRARRAIARLSRYAPQSRGAYWRLSLAVAEATWTDAEAAARDLFRDPEAPEGLVEAGRAALRSLDQGASDRLLQSLVRDSDAPPHVATAWVRSFTERGRTPSLLALRRLRKHNPEAATAALVALLNELGDQTRGFRVLWTVFWQLRFVRASDAVWGAAGYALARSRFALSTVLWHWGYERRHPEAWMLLNHAASLRALGFTGTAGAVSRHALGLPPDSSSPMHLTLLAFDAAVEGQIEEASTLLADIDTRALGDYYSSIRELTACLVTLARAEAGERPIAARAAFQELAKLHPGPFIALFQLRALAWRRAARSIGRRSGSAWGLVRGYWDTIAATVVVLWLIAAFTSDSTALLGLFVLALVPYFLVRSLIVHTNG